MSSSFAVRGRGGVLRKWLVRGLTVGSLALIAAAAWFWWPQLEAAAKGLVASRRAATGEHDEHAGHDHAAHSDTKSIKLSKQALANIGLKTAKIALGPFERTVTIPGMVAERPGWSSIQISAPLTGIVTRTSIIQGEAVVPGQTLFDMRMTHEELVQAQGDFLRTAEELEVVLHEVSRLEKVAAEGAIAGKTLLERKYEQQKLEAVLRSQRQALLLHGLTEDQVDRIMDTRTLVQGMQVTVPGGGMTATSEGQPRLLQVQELSVEQGQHVEAGQTLCVLADHAALYIVGNAFEQDAQVLSRAVEQGWQLSAVSAGAGEGFTTVGLEVLYIADQVDADSRTLHFYIRLPNQLTRDSVGRDGRRFIAWQFKPGQRVQLRVPVERWDQQIVLPVTAVVEDGPEAYVFQQNGDHFDRRPVHVKHRDPEWVVIANDGSIYPGDIVAITGADQMQIALKNQAGGAIDPHAGHNH